MYTFLIIIYAVAVLWFIIALLQLGASVGYHEVIRRKRMIVFSFLSVILIGVTLAIMNPWFWLYLPLTFVVLGIAVWILILFEEHSRWNSN